jgi:hypothetical protein
MKSLAGALLFSILTAACGHSPPPVVHAAPPAAAPRTAASPAFTATTDELIPRPEARVLVQELEKATQVGGAAVSYDGHMSAEYAVFSRLRAVATDAEMIALLRHRSPVVRSYAGRHVLERGLTATPVEPLLVDATPVTFQEGCMTQTWPVAHLTLLMLCDFKAQKESSRELGRLSSSDDAETAKRARECLGR